MKKRVFAPVLVVVMALTMAACGDNYLPPHTPPPANDALGGTRTPKSTPKQDDKPPSDLKDAPVSDFQYRYDAGTQGVVIEKYTGSAIKVRIPEKIEGEPVTGIGLRAFEQCGLKEIDLPDGLAEIGDYAFRKCTGLISVTIPASVTEIGDYAFMDCTALTSVTIPDSVTEIGSYAFNGCTALTSITIPDSVIEIGFLAFANCTGLTSVTIPNSVTVIGSGAFEGCTRLTSVTIPDSVTVLGGFQRCMGLTSITIPDSVTEIGPFAFANCTGLTSVIIPDSVTVIGDSAFADCTGLTSVIVPDGVTKIGGEIKNYDGEFNGAFKGCTGITVTYKGKSYRYDELTGLYNIINGE